jgi:serine phosphatase RsbU (regulator of sigma subunit)
MVDRTRVFFAVGDVSGKGIPASLFMALSKTLCKSVMMRAGGTVAQRLSIANAEIARENPQMMFVTMAAGLLDTASGELELCIAGHDAPWLLRSEQPPRELDADGGPPLCVMDDFDYPTEHFRLESGDTLVLSTDGISEAMDPGGNLYGRARLAALLAALDVGADPQHVVDAVLADVLRFADGGEPADDLTLLVLRYHGPVG